MAYTGINFLQISLDSKDRVWVVGQDLQMFDGESWYYYNYANSVVPSDYPYFLDTRSISISDNDTIWCGCAQRSNLEDTAIFYIDGNDLNNGRSWKFSEIGTFEVPVVATKVYASPFGNEVLAYFSPLNTNDLNLPSSYPPVYYWNYVDFNNSLGLFPSYNAEIDFFYSDFSTDDSGVLISGNRVYKTTDGGDSWTAKVSISLTQYLILGGRFTCADRWFTNYIVFINSDSIGLPGNYVISNDLLNTFTWGTISLINRYVSSVAYRSVTNITVLTTSTSSGSVQAYNSSNAGLTFTAGGNVATSSSRVNTKCQVFPSDPSKVMLLTNGGGFGRIHQIDLSPANSFLRYTATENLNDIRMKSISSIIAVGDNGSIYRGNTLSTYTKINHGLTTENLNSVRLNVDGTWWVGGDGGTILYSNDDGFTWIKALSLVPGSIDINCIDMNSPAVGYFGGDSGAFGKIFNYSEFTGGYLYKYDLGTDQWKEVVPDYRWPKVFDIKARGYGGIGYNYYLGSSNGVIEIQGEESDVFALLDGSENIAGAKYYNSDTYGLSDVVYSLAIDENNNLWTGCEGGKLQFWDFDKWSTFDLQGYNSATSSYVNFNTSITSLVSVENGHIFCAGVTSSFGVIHFNGVTASNYSFANTAYNSTILSLGVNKSNRVVGANTYFRNDIFVLSSNRVNKVSYDLPHIKASSKVSGATGWNFVYYTQATGGTSNTGDYSVRKVATSIPQANKYTWEYPYWLSYQSDYVKNKFPGLDVRNLFLSVPLSDIASGKAGNQDYWNSSPVPDYSNIASSEQLKEANWYNIFSNLSASNISSTSFRSSCIAGQGKDSKYLVALNMRGLYSPISAYTPISSSSIVAGNDINASNYRITPSNPSIFGGPFGSSPSAISGGPNFQNGVGVAIAEDAIIVSYDSKGSVISNIKIPGTDVSLRKIVYSENRDSAFVIGTFSGVIEVGDYLYMSNPGQVGPTGYPSGLTNQYVDGLSSNYSWIYETGGTGELSANSGLQWNFRNTSSNANSNFRLYYTDGTTQTSGTFLLNPNNGSLIKYISIGNSPVTGIFNTVGNNFSTGMTIQIGGAYFRIDSIITDYPDGNFSSATYMLGVTYTSGSQSFSNSIAYTFNIFRWNQLTFPLIRADVTDLPTYNEAVFVMEIDLNKGNRISLKDSSRSDISSGYCVKNFRYFPMSLDISPSVSVNFPLVTADISDDVISLLFSFNINGSATKKNSILTFKDLWKWGSDSSSVPDSITYEGTTASTMSNNILISMRCEDLGIENVSTFIGDDLSSTAEINSTSVRTISNTSTACIIGNSSKPVIINNTTLSYPGVTSSRGFPFYAIVNFADSGVTGAFISNFGQDDSTSSSSNIFPGNLSSGFLAKDEAAGLYYYGNQFYGASGGTYFGRTIDSDKANLYLNTFSFTPSNEIKNVVYGSLPDILTITNTGFGAQAASITTQDFTGSSPVISSDGYMYGFFAGATSNSTTASLQVQYLFKQSIKDGSVKTINLGNIRTNSGITYSVSGTGDFFFLGNNASALGGQTGPSWIGSVTTNSDRNVFAFLSEKEILPVGINMGQIISRPGSDPWVWCDVHQSDRGLEIPMMTTVFLSNYNSAIYGKKNNVWKLIDSRTEQVILDVKYTPYFIYTFTQSGYYTIYNYVEDSFGNVYETSKPGFITVVNHTEKRADDPQPLVVNSTDYGYPVPPKNRNDYFYSLETEMIKDQIQIMKDNYKPFYSDLIINDSSDSTFNQ